ncbi:MAG: amidohydrolase family protein [Planctomycetota bacterium]
MTTAKWIDTHVHVSDRGKDGRRHERLVEDVMDVFDRDEADLRWVISPDANWIGTVKQDAHGVAKAATFIRDLVRAAPGRLYGSCLVNPHFLKASLDVMDCCFGGWGFVQLGEMLQYMMDFVMDSDEVEALLRKAAEYDAPVEVHISTSNTKTHPSSFGTEQLEDLCRAADRVPEAKYILAHAVGGEKADPPVVDEYLDMVEDRYGEWPDNFWMEVRDFSSPGLRSALDRVPHTRLLAGTDWTNRVGPPFPAYGTLFAMGTLGADKPNPYPPCVAAMVDLLRKAGASDEAISAIGFGNAAELFRLPE